MQLHSESNAGWAADRCLLTATVYGKCHNLYIYGNSAFVAMLPETSVYRFFPFLRWLPELRHRQVLRADIIAGISVAMVLIPQSMAYAKLAGLPAVYGLYAALLPPAIATLFGSSRHLATGPVAMVSLISAVTVQQVAVHGSTSYITASILLAFMVGLLRLILGLLRLGAMANLLSIPVVSGFTNAAALVIITSQMHHLFGVDTEPGQYHYQTIARVFHEVVAAAHAPTVAMSLLATAILYVLRRWRPKIPHVLVAVCITTATARLSGFDGGMVGHIPAGLPSFVLPVTDLDLARQLAAGAMVITVVGLMEAMSIAKTIAARTRQAIDVNRELIGQGLANAVGALFQSYAVSGSFSRSAINYHAGAVTGFAAVVCSVVIMFALLFLTPFLYQLPLATLAVIIVFALAHLLQFEPIVSAWRLSPYDGAIGVITFVVTLALAPQLHYGILTGVVLSTALFLYRTTQPRFVYLSRHGDGTLRDADAHSLKLDQRIALLRFDGRLYFGASNYFEDKILEALERLPNLRFIVIDAGGINQIDASGEQVLRQVILRLRDNNIDVYFTRVKQQILEALQRTGAMEIIGHDHFFSWNQHALEHIWESMEPSYKARCPLNVATPDSRAGAWTI